MSQLNILREELRKVNVDLEKFYKLWGRGGGGLPRYAKRDLKAMTRRKEMFEKDIAEIETETPHGIV